MPYLSLAITLLTLWWFIRKWSATITNLKNDINSCNVSTINKNNMQQKDIDILMDNKKVIWEKLNNHDIQLTEFSKVLAVIETNTKNMWDSLKRIESKIK